MTRERARALAGQIERLGSCRTAFVPRRALVFSAEFRAICETGTCGKYNRCYMCPPNIGSLEYLKQKIEEFNTVLVYQTVGCLEDSFDFEGMMRAKAIHSRLCRQVTHLVRESGAAFFHLGPGGCLCDTCAKQTGEPCRFPGEALPSLEGCGISVSELASAAGLNYINGPNTVTYFSALLLNTEIF